MKRISAVIMISFFSQSVFAKGTLTYLTFFSESLQKNMSIATYLPEGYDTAGSKRYPVIYFLHGGYSSYTPYTAGLATALDDMIGSGQIQPYILVAPDGSGGSWGGTFWANSPLWGQVEDYVTQDVVSYVDKTYLTMAVPEARAMTGFSDGGDGSMVTGLRHPEVYRCIASHSGFYNWDLIRGDFRTWVLAECPGGPPYNYKPVLGTATCDLFRVAGAYSPNPENLPYKVDLPLDADGNIVEQVLDKWKAFNADVLIAALPPDQVPDLYFTCGAQDFVNYPGNLYLKNALDAMGIPHTFVPAPGAHGLSQEDLKGMFSHINDVVSRLTGVHRRKATVISDVTLYDNYPNPFNPCTTISFEQPQNDMPVQLAIFNCNGGYVTTLVDGHLSNGHHKVTWDGMDQHGNRVSSGVYLYRLLACGSVTMKKMTLLK